MSSDGPPRKLIEMFTDSLERAHARAEEAAGRRARLSVRQIEYDDRLEQIRIEAGSTIEALVKAADAERFMSWLDNRRGAGVTIGDERGEHLVTWQYGLRAEPFLPMATVTFAAVANRDATDGDIVIRFAKLRGAENEVVRHHPEFVSTMTDGVTAVLNALREVDAIASEVESKVGPVDRNTVATVLVEAARLIDIQVAILMAGEAEFRRRNVLKYKPAAIQQDIAALIRQLS